MNKGIVITIRIIAYLISFGLIYGVYKETGIFTAIFAFIIFVYVELTSSRKREMLKLIKETSKKDYEHI